MCICYGTSASLVPFLRVIRDALRVNMSRVRVHRFLLSLAYFLIFSSWMKNSITIAHFYLRMEYCNWKKIIHFGSFFPIQYLPLFFVKRHKKGRKKKCDFGFIKLIKSWYFFFIFSLHNFIPVPFPVTFWNKAQITDKQKLHDTLIDFFPFFFFFWTR